MEESLVFVRKVGIGLTDYLFVCFLVLESGIWCMASFRLDSSIRRLFPVIEAFGDLTRLMWQFIVSAPFWTNDETNITRVKLLLVLSIKPKIPRFPFTIRPTFYKFLCVPPATEDIQFYFLIWILLLYNPLVNTTADLLDVEIQLSSFYSHWKSKQIFPCTQQPP